MTPDQYLISVLQREAVDTSLNSPVRAVQGVITPVIQAWAGQYLQGIGPSGSFAKGTANRSGTDIDLFISLAPNTPVTLKEIYENLYKRLDEEKLSPKRQNVSINIRLGAVDIDLVPGKQQNALSSDHSLYRRRGDTWMQTNVAQHINLIRTSGRTAEMRLLKLWRKQKGLEFLSFYVELTTIEALKGKGGILTDNIRTSLEYLRDKFETARVVDPANTNNVISDDLTATEKKAIKTAAVAALAGNWTDFVK